MNRRSRAWPALALAVACAFLVGGEREAFAQNASFTPRPSTPEFESGELEVTGSVAPPPRTGEATDPNRLVRVPLSAVGREAIRGGQVRWSVLIVAVGLLATLAAAISLHHRLTRKPNEAAPGQAFLAYARQIGLTWPEVVLLWRIARANQLPTPLALLVASGTLYHHGRQYAAGFSMQRRDRVHRAMSAIHRKAFPTAVESPSAAETDPNANETLAAA